ncbi:MAG: amidohydrolase [Nocardioides sp.]|uniref:amidohydrolase n=1 Tax=Nocardioides sp. TaxID=35761 RepID=UPI0039E3BB0C
MPADLILTGGTVRTLDRVSSAARRVAEAVAVRDGRIVAVGSAEEIAGLRGPATEVVDLDGRTVLPGVHDGHMHLAMWAANRPEYSIDLSRATSVQEVVDAVARRIAERPQGSWVKGHGWYEARVRDLDGRWPTRQELDAVSPSHPVVLVHFSEHAVWANSLALAAAGITAATPDPEGGTILRDADGEPAGYLVESAGDLMLTALPQPTRAEADAAVGAAMQQLLDLGFTSVTDPMVGPGLLRQYARMHNAGGLPLRVGVLLHWAGLGLPNNADEIERALGFSGMVTGLGDHVLRIAGAKLFADGIPPLRTSWTSRPYGEGCHGSLLTDGETDEARLAELTGMVEKLHRARLQVQVHATGDRACDAAFDAFAAAHLKDPWPDARHALIHANLLSPQTARRMAEHGYCANTNALIKWSVADALPATYGDERAGYSSPMRSLIDAGLHVADTSDAPVSDPDWRQGVECLVLREARGSGRVSGPEERVSREEALRAWTIEAAYQEHTDHLKGTIEPGKLADLVVLEEDPLTIDEHQLHALTVAATYVGGVHRGGPGL